MRKSELYKEIAAWKWVATHAAKFTEQLHQPVVIARLTRETDYLYKKYQEEHE